MELAIKVELKPLSLNNAYKNNPKGGRSASKGLTQFKKDFRNLTLNYKRDILKFRSLFSSDLHYLSVDYFFFFPQSYIIKKSGGIKSRIADRCNLLKVPTDCLVELLDIDDAFILDGLPLKLISPDDKFYMVFKINKVPLETLFSASVELSKELL